MVTQPIVPGPSGSPDGQSMQPGGNLERFVLDVLARSPLGKRLRQLGRDVRGTVDGATGGIIAGGGFTCVRSSAGSYTVTFGTPFAQTPSVVASPAQSPAGVSAYVIEPQSVTVNGFVLLVREPGVAFVDCTFGFSAAT